MDPKKQDAMLAQLTAMLQAHNRNALIEYARFLKRCGVQQPRIWDLIVIPGQ